MKFKGPFSSQLVSVGEVVNSQLGVLDLYRGGTVEHLEEKVEKLRWCICTMVELMPPEQQIALVALISPSHQPVQENT